MKDFDEIMKKIVSVRKTDYDFYVKKESRRKLKHYDEEE